jgi:WhiB family redox-sensing transcriptional regulator
MNVRIFFPDPHKGETSARAKAVCAVCEVWEECATWAVMHGEFRGVYGGMSFRERRRWAHKRDLKRDVHRQERDGLR